MMWIHWIEGGIAFWEDGAQRPRFHDAMRGSAQVEVLGIFL